ncbi:MAG: hypothetical protein CM1200mP41_12270 [Gammaproteobacteria bacterium]|nr:MAG: hypothetical protein CM1200mP41_12270 [Gammaproteobacteria bacterium]
MHINNEDLVDEVGLSRGATQQLIPLVLDSPHSGTFYPSDFGHQVPIEQLRWGEELMWSGCSKIPRYRWRNDRCVIPENLYRP